MKIWWQKLRDRDVPATAFVFVMTLLILLLVRQTGGIGSDYLPLIYLPIIMAVVRCSFEMTLVFGLFISASYLFFLRTGAVEQVVTRGDVVRGLSIILMTLIGASYSLRVRSERDALRTAVLEKQNLVEEKEHLLDVSQVINAADKMEHALNSILLMLRTLLPQIRYAAVFLSDEAQRSMELAEVIGADRSELRFERFSPTELIGWKPDSTHPLSLSDAAAQTDVRLAELVPHARSVVCLGLRSLNILMGMLYVASDQVNAFSEADIRLLRDAADRIGFPLQRIRTQEGLRGMAFTDAMTGLYNYRSFSRQLEDEFKRSVRYKRPLSLVVFDLDGFKGINDRYGHQAGDKLLAGIARIIRHSVRETDVAARYGGEEFVIVCPETLGEDALIVAERVRHAVEGARFQLTATESCAVTISGGVATYPTDAQDEQSLIQRADSSLYYAKRNGKNRVVLSVHASDPEKQE